jgi:hypothetical protein
LWTRKVIPSPNAPFFDNIFFNSVEKNTFVQELPALESFADTGMPSGFIFHSGRCGSTHLCRLIMTTKNCITISEPSVVSDFLIQSSDWPRIKRVELLKRLVFSLTAAYQTRGKKVFFKWTSFNTLFLDLFIEAFPKVRWIYVFRDPQYTLPSQIYKPPRWSLSSEEILTASGIKNKTGLSNVAKQCKVLRLGFNNAKKNFSSCSLFVNYQEIISGLPDQVLKHFALSKATTTPSKTRIVLGTYSKSFTSKSVPYKVRPENENPKIIHFKNSEYQQLRSTYLKFNQFYKQVLIRND